MPEFLTNAFKPPGDIAPVTILLRLAVALLLGVTVAWIYRRARGPSAANGSFPGTLVLLAVLIAMVTQVIGDNVARAFSLVGALSIVRFRTVVRDTQDTAYVIFAVVVGMAVGAQDLWVAGIGVVIVAFAAIVLLRGGSGGDAPLGWRLSLRVGVGVDADTVLRRFSETHLQSHELVTIETARQGIALDVVYRLKLRATSRPEALVHELNRIEGVQDVALERAEPEAN